jgi:uncharacterized cupin superfamily protein
MPAMRRFNVFTPEFTYADTRPPGYRAGSVRFGPLIGAARMAGTVYELPPGESTWPYHYEYGSEEWLLVLDGTPTLRHADGEDALEPGDLVCFPNGPEGAHKVTNKSDVVARLMIVSTYERPAVAVFPDSDKLGVWPDGERDMHMSPRDSNVDYWTGEA